MDAEGWRAVVTSIVFLVFFTGVVVTYQAIVGKDPGIARWIWAHKPDPKDPGIVHPPEQHRWETAGIGLGLIVAAVVLAIVFIA